MSTTNIARLATTGSNIFTSNQIVTGSLTTTGSATIIGNTIVTGSLTIFSGSVNVSGSITGSLLGTASFATTASFAPSSISIGTTITSATQNSVLFAGASGVLQQDNASFSWDDTNNRLNISGSISINSGSAILSINSGSATGTPKFQLSGVDGNNTAGSAANIELRAAKFSSAEARRWLLQIDGSDQFGTWYFSGISYSKVGYQTTGGTWTNSDERRKENIQLINYGLNEILQLTPKKFNFKIDNYKTKCLGFIAQDVLPIIPEAVQSDMDNGEQYYAMNYDNLVPVLVNAIKEQQLQIDQLKAEIEILKNK
jgi:hypothetical protein